MTASPPPGLLPDRAWKSRYDSTARNLVDDFYVPALRCAKSYDRVTGYFSASVLTLAARGIASLVHNAGHMRLVVGCSLDPPEIEALARGEELRDVVAAKLATLPLEPKDALESDVLELLAWLVARGVLEVRVAVPADAEGRPLTGTEIFHEKAGIVTDTAGNRLAFHGSLNETAQGWTGNIESLHVFCAWKGEESGERVAEEAAHFDDLWERRLPHVLIVDVPEAIAQKLLPYQPPEGCLPKLLGGVTVPPQPPPETPEEQTPPPAAPVDWDALRRLAWGVIEHTPAMAMGGERVGEATANIEPWPHQIRAFHRMYDQWPPKLLIADEVGLGKTIEAGLVLRQAWLAGRAKRILILAPRAVRTQWQIELREKFNLNWPIYDGAKLVWYPSVGLPEGRRERDVSREDWHKEPCVITSSHLMRRKSRAPELTEHAEPYDLVVLDEAHHARRKGAGSTSMKGPNLLLQLMQKLVTRTQGLILLTATPMQVHPVEVYDLLKLLGLPDEWSEGAFQQYFDILGRENPGHHEVETLARLFQAVERRYGPTPEDSVVRFVPGGSRMAAKTVLNALRDDAKTKRQTLKTEHRTVALKVLRANTPVGRLISRNTRELLREYYKAGKMSTRIADRAVADEMLPLSEAERHVYEAVEDYISSTYNAAKQSERPAVGFVMTIYRRRLASSFHALRKTLEGRLKAVERPDELVFDEDNVPDEDEAETDTGDALDADDAAALAAAALKLEEMSEIERLLHAVAALPPDSKAVRLAAVLRSLRAGGYPQCIVFTQFTDTMDFLRKSLLKEGFTVLCFSGRGGEVVDHAGTWRKVSREDIKRRFREGKAELLLCTDAAAEGLNFQFCGALVNYDMPWNPMRVEQRIGRIDRLGQQHPTIRIVNLHYERTVETDVYMALRSRIQLFTAVVGKLQPILSQLPRRIGNLTLVRREERERDREAMLGELTLDIAHQEKQGFDLDEITGADLEIPVRPLPRFDLDALDALLRRPELLPPGMKVRPMGERQYGLTMPGLPAEIRVTTDRTFFDAHGDSVEMWSPGSPVFVPPDSVATAEEVAAAGARLMPVLIDAGAVQLPLRPLSP
jgi:superfamily II DNA or RNA helicase